MPALTHRVTARNGATASENRIHDDEVARRHGFRGGLVPGVTLYGYMTRPVVERFGRAWLERGTMSVRFVAPIYDGQEVVVVAEDDQGDGVGAGPELSLELRNPEGRACAVGRAGVPVQAGPPPPAEDYPVVEAPPPERRPPADERSLAPGTALATVWSGVHTDSAGPLLALLDDPLPVYTEQRLAHPGHLILAANAVLTNSVSLGPWVHVESAVANFRAVADGALVETRARVRELFERGGHRFVVLDVLWLADGEPALHAVHTAIYRLRGGTMEP